MNSSIHNKSVIFILLLLAVTGIGCVSCTKQSGCEFVEGLHYKGTLHYYSKAVRISTMPFNEQSMDVHAYFVKENPEHFTDTILITKASIPLAYRKESAAEVSVALASTTNIELAYLHRGFYKIVCIEKD